MGNYKMNRDKVERTVKKENDKVFAVTRTEMIEEDGLLKVRILESEVTDEKVNEYLSARDTEVKSYKRTEQELKDKFAKHKKQLEKDSNTREYLDFKNNFNTYETFEVILEKNLPLEILNEDTLKQFNTYKLNRNSMKNHYVTYTIERDLDSMKGQLDNFEFIWEEDKMFLEQMKQAKELLNGESR